MLCEVHTSEKWKERDGEVCLARKTVILRSSIQMNVNTLKYPQPLLYIYYQELIDSKEKRACNLIQTEAKNSNKFCINYSTKAAKVTKIVQFYCWFEFYYL